MYLPHSFLFCSNIMTAWLLVLFFLRREYPLLLSGPGMTSWACHFVTDKRISKLARDLIRPEVRFTEHSAGGSCIGAFCCLSSKFFLRSGTAPKRIPYRWKGVGIHVTDFTSVVPVLPPGSQSLRALRCLLVKRMLVAKVSRAVLCL